MRLRPDWRELEECEVIGGELHAWLCIRLEIRGPKILHISSDDWRWSHIGHTWPSRGEDQGHTGVEMGVVYTGGKDQWRFNMRMRTRQVVWKHGECGASWERTNAGEAKSDGELHVQGNLILERMEREG